LTSIFERDIIVDKR